jgi:hypothetical protein
MSPAKVAGFRLSKIHAEVTLWLLQYTGVQDEF